MTGRVSSVNDWLNSVWKKQPVAEWKIKQRATTGFAFFCSKRCDGFFNEASPSAGKWTKSVVAAAEQIGNSFVCKINYHGVLFLLSPTLLTVFFHTSVNSHPSFPTEKCGQSMEKDTEGSSVCRVDRAPLFSLVCQVGGKSFWLVFIWKHWKGDKVQPRYDWLTNNVIYSSSVGQIKKA